MRRTETLSAVPIGDFGRLTALLEKYVSRTIVRAVLLNAVARLDVTPHEIRPEHMNQLCEEALLGLKLFCEPNRLPDLMHELEQFRLEVEGRAKPT